MSGCLIKIKESYSGLTPSERKVASFVLQDPAKSVGLSIGELAELSGASKAAIIRFCKTLGFDGYRDFSIKIASDIAVSREKSGDKLYTDIKVGDDLDTIIRNISHNNKQAIDDTLKVLDFHEVERAVEALKNAGRIDFYGMGASGLVAQDGQQKFMRINRIANAFADTHLQVTAATILSSGDVAVLISYSGETKDIIDIVDLARESGATTIAITKYGNNTLSGKADICLQISSPETSMRPAASSSRVAQLNIIDILFTAIASENYSEIKNYLERTSKVRELKELRNHPSVSLDGDQV